MIDKTIKEKNSNDELLENFKSLGNKINFETGEIVSSQKFVNQSLFNQEWKCKINNKNKWKINISFKLSTWRYNWYRITFRGKPIEEVRASKELVVYAIEDKKFLEIYKKNLNIKYFCDTNIWEAEKLSILKKFPKLNNKSLLLNTDLFEVIHKKISLITPDEIQIINSLKNKKILFFNYFSDDYEIWSEIESFFK